MITVTKPVFYSIRRKDRFLVNPKTGEHTLLQGIHSIRGVSKIKAQTQEEWVMLMTHLGVPMKVAIATQKMTLTSNEFKMARKLPFVTVVESEPLLEIGEEEDESVSITEDRAE